MRALKIIGPGLIVVYALKTTLLQIWDKLDKCAISMKKYAGIKCEGALYISQGSTTKLLMKCSQSQAQNTFQFVSILTRLELSMIVTNRVDGDADFRPFDSVLHIYM